MEKNDESFVRVTWVQLHRAPSSSYVYQFVTRVAFSLVAVIDPCPPTHTHTHIVYIYMYFYIIDVKEKEAW